MKILNFITIVLLIIGGLNWFLVGIFDINVVNHFLGHMTLQARIVYILVGLSALYVLLNFKSHL